ncbi:MAG: HEPN domain-containing protein [Thaumarchaeota archaeon]|nr:HEPN domain-containing protein [Nitrososphaerota archaeon]MCL5318417.1 HEPN domain-containing protein [Nitrososphaerota archaeon]
MGSGISSELQQLLAERKIFRARIDRKMVVKEVEAAETDLVDAQESLELKKFKWATIQAYYSMFHSTRALLYSRGYREKSHYALLVAIRDLFKNELGGRLISSFEEGMTLRQEADYGLNFSEEGAAETAEGAEDLLKKAKEILKIS